MDKFTVKQVKERLTRLRADRVLWENQWQEVADYMLPNRNTITNFKSPGQKRSVNVLDSTGIQSNELLAGALHGLLTNPNAEWFELTTGILALDRDDEVRKWMQLTTRSIHNVLNNSNFQTEIHELYLDLCAFGTGNTLIEEDDVDVVRFSTRFIGEFFIEENENGVVDQLYREFRWDAAKIIAVFGDKVVGKKVRDSFDKQDMQKFCIVHAVYPRFLVNRNHRSPFKFVSQYLLIDEDIELKDGGFRDFPYVVPRWTKASGETYGRSPAMNALPEVKTLNKMTETVLIGAQKVVDPPLQLPDDGFIMPIVTTPGGLNYYRSGTNDVIKPVFNESRIDFGYQAMEDGRKRVRAAFYVDQLQLQQGPQMTATEVLQRTEEKMRLLGPMLGRQQSELLRPMVDRVFAIMLAKGIIDPKTIPQALRGRNLNVKYSSLIAKSQRVAEGQNILRTMQAITPFVNMNQQVADNFDGDAAVKAIGEIFGFPQELIRGKKEVAGMRQARAEAQQQMLQQQQQQAEVAGAKDVASTMKELSTPA